MPLGSDVNIMLLKSILALLPAGILFTVMMRLFQRRRTLSSLLQLAGAGCLVIVVLAHLCEALGLLPWMGWGHAQSIGHYVDLSSAILGLTLLAIGFGVQLRAGRDPFVS